MFNIVNYAFKHYSVQIIIRARISSWKLLCFMLNRLKKISRYFPVYTHTISSLAFRHS